MSRRRVIAAITLAAFAISASGCASTFLIDSTPAGAEVYVDGIPVGHTPTSYTDTAIINSVRIVELRMEGYEVHRAEVRRDGDMNVGALVGTICLLVPGLWLFDYPRHVHYQLRPLHGGADESSEGGPDGRMDLVFEAQVD